MYIDQIENIVIHAPEWANPNMDAWGTGFQLSLDGWGSDEIAGLLTQGVDADIALLGWQEAEFLKSEGMI